MWKHFSLFFYFFLTFSIVFCLNCYSVPFGTEISEARDVLVNCDETIRQRPLYSSSSVSCYKVVVTELSGNHTQYLGKGCMTPSNHCKAAIRVWQVAIKQQEVDVKCYECAENECNSAPTIAISNLCGLFLVLTVFVF